MIRHKQIIKKNHCFFFCIADVTRAGREPDATCVKYIRVAWMVIAQNRGSACAKKDGVVCFVTKTSITVPTMRHARTVGRASTRARVYTRVHVRPVSRGLSVT